MNIRNCDEIRREISEIESKLEIIIEQINDKQAEKEQIQSSQAGLIEKSIRASRRSKSIGVQRQRLLDLNLQLEELSRVKESLEKRVSDLRNGFVIARIYQEKVATYKEAELELKEKASRVITEIEEVNSRIESCGKMMNDFLEHQPENTVMALRNLLGDPALSGLSLPKLFDGQISEPATPDENGNFLKQLVSAYRALWLGLPTIKNIEKERIGLANRLDLLNRAAGQLVPKSVKHVSTGK